MVRFLAVCPSPPHRSVLSLLRAAMDCGVDHDALLADLRQSDPQDLVRIATASYVHVVLHKAFDTVPELAAGVPEDLLIFLDEMQQANLRRNKAIQTQLLQIGRIFAEAGINGVVLKGGAELLAPLHPDPAFRFLSDLDILLPEDQLVTAVRCLHDRGAVSQEEDEINQRRSHHQEPLWHPAWKVPVELHQALGAEKALRILPAEEVLRDAHPSQSQGLSLPAPTHRLVHAVLHAQIEPPRYRDGSLSPRDLIEMEAMVRQLPAVHFAEAKAYFDLAGERDAWEAFDAARLLLFGDTSENNSLSTAARMWAEQAFISFGRPRRRRLALGLKLSAYYARVVLSDPERRRHYLGQLLRPGRLGKAIRYQRDKFRRLP